MLCLREQGSKPGELMCQTLLKALNCGILDREARTHIALDLLSSCESKHFMFLGNDFQLGEIKGKVQFSLYL